VQNLAREGVIAIDRHYFLADFAHRYSITSPFESVDCSCMPT
jgi:hypothetical protein